jgi:glycosyltransferase involved in cell wall biosynthesis
MFFTVLLALIPFHRCRLTTLDFFIGSLERRGLRGALIGWSLRHTDRFLVYVKDSSMFERAFGIPRDRFHYINFKLNGYELIRNASITDEGYIFCGGRSRRDFACLFKAVEPLGYKVKLLTSSESEMAPHGSTLAGLSVPPNVEVFTNDHCLEFFISLIAGSRLVVIPIVPNVTTQAGIGVYLQAMALGKCVIISSGLGVDDVLGQGQAYIVKAGEPDELREAIEKAWNDPDLRGRYGEAGRAFALPLGGEDDLRRRILEALPPTN